MVPFYRLAGTFELFFYRFNSNPGRVIQQLVAGKPGKKMHLVLSRCPCHKFFTTEMTITANNDNRVFPNLTQMGNDAT